MRHVTVRVTCTGCGEVIMTASQMRVITGHDLPVAVYDCPGCKTTAAVVVPDHALTTLVAGGAGHAILDTGPNPSAFVEHNVARFRELLDAWDGTIPA